jgi:hypothetical protein
LGTVASCKNKFFVFSKSSLPIVLFFVKLSIEDLAPLNCVLSKSSIGIPFSPTFPILFSLTGWSSMGKPYSLVTGINCVKPI